MLYSCQKSHIVLCTTNACACALSLPCATVADGNHQQETPESNTARDAPQHTNDAQSRAEASTRQSQMPTFQPTAGLDMTSLPDGIASWREQRGIQIVWLLSSIFMVVLDVAGLDIGFLAGLLGICGASLAVCNCCQFTDLRGIVRVSSILTGQTAHPATRLADPAMTVLLLLATT